MKKNSSTAHNSAFTRVVCMLLVTVLLCGLGWTGIVASAESMQAGSAVSEQIADNMTEGAVETEQPAPTEAPEHMGELPTMDEALGLVAAPQGQTADGVYYFGEQTDTEGLYVKVEVIDKSEGAVLPEGAQLKLKASEKAAEYVRQSILKKAELADDEFFFLYDLSFVDKDGKEIDVGTGSGKSFKVTVYMAGEGNNFADAEGSLNVVSLPYTIGELETAEDIKLEEAEKKAAEEPQTEDKPAEAEPAQTEQPAAEEKAEPVTEDKAEEPAPAEEPAKAEEANEAKAEEKVEEKAEEKTEETEKSVIPARETKVVVSDLLKVEVSYVFNTNGLGVFAFYGKKDMGNDSYQEIYDKLMAAETIEDFDVIFDGIDDSVLDDFTAWLTEKGLLGGLEEYMSNLPQREFVGETIFPSVPSVWAAPALPAVKGTSSALKKASAMKMLAASRAAEDESEDNSNVSLDKKVVDNGDGTANITLEAFATGEQSQTTKSTPVDIILVLDQSGSMAYDFSTLTSQDYVAITGGTNSTYYAYYRDNTKIYYKDTDGSYNSVKVTRAGRDYLFYNTYTYTYTYEKNGITYTIAENSSGPNTNPGFVLYTQRNSGSNVTKLQALTSAVNTFANQIAADANAKKINHRVAVVGFASGSRYDVDYDNTEVFIGRNQYKYGTNAKNQYAKALQDMSTAAGVANVNASISALDAYGGTMTDLGIEMANGIFDANPIAEGSERKRVVVVFTDGEPGWSGYDSTVASNAVTQASTAKNKYGATVYTVGIFQGANVNGSDNVNTFMRNMSSGSGYYLTASKASELDAIFKAIASATGGAGNESLTEKTVLRDTVTPYFDVPVNATGYKIYTMDCTGIDGDGNLLFGNKQPATGVTVVPTENNNGTDGTSTTLSISGFNYSENWCGKHIDVDNGGREYYAGKKLVIEFTVTRKDAFIGGNGVPTNGNTSDGLYPPESDDMLKPFPTPERIDVPIWESSLSAVDKNVYLHGSLSQSDLADGAKITLVNNSKTEIVLDGSKENYGLDKWQNAYVTISSDKTDSQISNIIADQDYTLKVDIKPKTTGDAIDVVLDAKAKINVFKPEITFNDTVIEYGDPANYTDNGGATIWKHGNAQDTDVKMSGTAKPTLDFNYDPAAGAFTGDTPVKVTVDLVNADNTKYSNINADVTFHHDKCDYEGCTWNDTTDAHFIVHVRQIRITVIKNVEGNFGDKNKQFTITVSSDVTLVAAENNGGSTFTDGTRKTYLVPANKSITIAETADNYTMTVTVGTKSYTVVENKTCTIGANELKNGDVVTVTNTRNTTPDMGVSLDSMPYIVVLAAVAVAAVVIILRKRRNNDD